MNKLFTNYNSVLSRNLSFLVVDNVFTKEECFEIIKIGKNCEVLESKLVDGFVNNEIRNSRNSFILPEESNDWIFQKLMGASSWVNENYFQFDLSGFSAVQYSEYGVGDYYDWHKDLIFNQKDVNLENYTKQTRKLSASVFLSDRGDYLNGDLYIERDSNNNPVNTIPQSIGNMVFFPSTVDHKVSEVTDGVRASLVFWIEGPKYK